MRIITRSGLASATRRCRVALTLVVAFTACREATAPNELSTAEALWRARRPAAYHVTVTPSCFCALPGDVVVTVRGSGVTRRAVATGEPLPADLASLYPTVDELFATIASAKAAHLAAVNVTYDATYGFPRTVFIDRMAQVADDEISYSMQHFVPE